MICTIHGRSYEEHTCLYCCLCFKDLTPEDCNITSKGDREDVCKECADKEQGQLKLILEGLHKALRCCDHYGYDCNCYRKVQKEIDRLEKYVKK